jgi:RNA polymerase sigma-70 factor, ECF subfamily
MAYGPQPALGMINAIAATKELENYHLLHAARADMLRRLDLTAEAATSYRRALELVTNESERKFLERRLREIETPKEARA